MPIYFRRDIGRILSAWFRSLFDKAMRQDHHAQTGWLVIATRSRSAYWARH